MAAEKMYYNEDEAAAKLRATADQLTKFAKDGKLQQYQDGSRKVYRADQVEKLAAQLAMEETGEIELTPADTTAGDAVSLTEAEEPTDTGKEDTVITAEGISIFDDDDLEIEAADPMAKTQIAPSLEDQISLEGVGSGSGLLDLTRESDDTSLGEVLDPIDLESAVVPSIEAETPEASQVRAPAAEAAMAIEAPMAVEEIDPGAGLFSGLAMGCCLVALLLGVVALPAMLEQTPSFIEILKNNMLIAIPAAAVLAVVCGVVGLVMGKSAASRQAAIRKAAG